jgi:hypothetical protein
VLGLAEDCFELTALRRYRDEVLIKMPDGAGEIALYYCVAPAILAEMPREERAARLGPLYARYILPSAVAAWLGFDGLTYRLYGSMMRSLMREFAIAEQ